MTSDKKTDSKPVEPFLARWARTKHDAKSPAPSPPDSVPAIVAETQITSIGGPSQHKVPEEARPAPTLPEITGPVELPVIENMTPQSDFSPFMAPNVDPLLRNQAMKKLFTDPHYNVMDRLDIYIDDYSTHPPLPIEVIRQMSISKTLRLFDDEDEQDQANKGAKEDAPAHATKEPAVNTALPAEAVPVQPPAMESEVPLPRPADAAKEPTGDQSPA